jgi:uncharacterized protein (DUF58 family)
MDTQELLKRVRRIEIKTKGLSKHIFSGEYHSAFKGRGMSFSEVRNYQFGDDVRNIDWNVTARTGEPHIKIFEEERELTVILIIDVSASSYFGTQANFKSDLATEIAAVLGFSAINNNDKVGVILFSDHVEKYIPPKKGKKHILRIIRELINFEPSQTGTDIVMALQYFNNVVKKRSITFVMSDFMSRGYKSALQIVSKKHDIVGLHLYDATEIELPAVGMLKVQDAESGKYYTIDTNSKKVREKYNQTYKERLHYFSDSFIRSGADTISVRTDESYIKALIKFFKKRIQH